jgi:hypothetical protein
MRKSIVEWVVAAPIVALTLTLGGVLLLSGGGSPSDAAAPTEPARVVQADGTSQTRVILTRQAATRLDIRSAAVREVRVAGTQRTFIPYGALLYDASGETFAYVRAKPLTFVRTPVVVDDIRGSRVILSRGPAAGSAVVVVGAEELLGIETGVDDE